MAGIRDRVGAVLPRLPRPLPSRNDRGMHRRTLALAMLVLAVAARLGAQTNLSRQPTLYVVGYAHLDTQWRWEYPQTIGEFLPKTMRENFALFEKYPSYVFNFSGA